VDPFDRSADITGNVEGGLSQSGSDDESIFGTGWSSDDDLLLPGGEDAYTPRGPLGLKQDKEGADPHHHGHDDDGEDPGAMTGAEHTAFILGLRDIPAGADRAFEAYFYQHTGQSWEDYLASHVMEPEPCIGEYVFSWITINEDCLPNGLDGDALESLCDPPCIFGRTIPTAFDALQATADLDVEQVGDAELHDLFRCGWTLLLENTDLIDFIACTLTGNPDAGDCIIDKLKSDEVGIFFTCEHDDVAAYAVSYTSEDVALTALALWLLGPFAAAIVAAVTIKTGLEVHICPDDDDIDSMLRDFTALGDCQTCGCIAMAALMLHEVAHLCWRDILDDETCGFADMIQNSFEFMAAERYMGGAANTCCDFYGKWWSEL